MSSGFRCLPASSSWPSPYFGYWSFSLLGTWYNGALSSPRRSISAHVCTYGTVVRSTHSIHRDYKLRRGKRLMEFLRLVYRLNTYPLIHLGFLHAFLNAIALVPLMERFEAEHGTLLTGAMFLGRMMFISSGMLTLIADRPIPALSTIPAGAYLLIERVILRGNTAVMGARYGYLPRDGANDLS